jgi:protein-S-isoprenylcysteine O-methyltransferase Ste14
MSRHRTNEGGQHQRHDLTGEHPFGDAGQLILAFLFLAVWVADTFFLKYTTFLNQRIPLAIRISLGVVLILLAGYLASKGQAIVFGDRREKPGVIREGVFGIVRHPLYLSEMLLFLGLLMMSLSLAAGFVCLIAIGFLHFIATHEETLLLARFGEEYQAYRRDVPMWIPKLRKRQSGE